MSEVSQDELSDFFVFAKELNGRVALARSEATGKLIGLVTANDLSGISLTGSGEFRSGIYSLEQKVSDVFCFSLTPSFPPDDAYPQLRSISPIAQSPFLTHTIR